MCDDQAPDAGGADGESDASAVIKQGSGDIGRGEPAKLQVTLE